MKNHSTTLVVALLALSGGSLALAQQLVPAVAPEAKPAVTPVVTPAVTPVAVPVPAGTGVAGVPLPANSPLKFETTIHDYGKIGDTGPVSFEFKFTNTSDKVVNILSVSSTCGCTNVTSDKVIQPGATGKISTTFNPAGRQGREVKPITVMLDDPNCPRIELTTVAEVLRRVMIEPMQVYMGEVPFRAGGSQELSITGRAEGFDVKSFKLADPNFTVELLGKDKVDVSGDMLNRVRYRIALKPDAPISRLQSNMEIETTDPTMPRVNVLVLADIVGRLRVNPPQIGVRMSQPNEPFLAEGFLEARDGQPFRITGLEFDPGASAAGPDLRIVLDAVPREPGSRVAYRIRVSGTTPQNAGQIRGSVKISTDVKDQETVAIPLMGFQVGPVQPMVQPVVAPGANPGVISKPSMVDGVRKDGAPAPARRERPSQEEKPDPAKPAQPPAQPPAKPAEPK